MHNVHWIFVDLLNYEFYHTLAPDVVFVPYVHLRVYLKVFHLLGFLYLLPFLMPLLPFYLQRFCLAAIHHLIDNFIHFEAFYKGLISDLLVLLSVEIAHETSLFVDKVIIKTAFTVRVATKCCHTFLDQLVTKWAHKFFESLLLIFITMRDNCFLRLFLADFLVIYRLEILVHDVVSALKFPFLPDAFKGAVGVSLSQHFFVV